MKRLVRAALQLYPRRWRNRYGEEVGELADELIEHGEATAVGAAASLARSGAVERIRAARRHPIVLVSSCLAVVIAGAILVALAVQTPSRSQFRVAIPTETDFLYSPARTANYYKLVDYLAAYSGSHRIGYIPKAYVYGPDGTQREPPLGSVAPVYASNLKTLVGYVYPGVGFVRLDRVEGAASSAEPRVTRLFLREASGGVLIRAYSIATTTPPHGLDGELSTDRAIGFIGATSESVGAGVLVSESTTLFGSNGADAVAVAVRTGSAIARVSVRLSAGGTDSMRPVHGWAILAARGNKWKGVVLGYDGSGKQITSGEIPKPTIAGDPTELTRATFVRTTSQGILIVGHMVNGWFSPDIADRYFAMGGLEGLNPCTPTGPTDVVAEVQTLQDGDYPLAGVGPPVTFVAVYSGSAIARVSVLYANHIQDSMRTVNGIAALATLGTVANNMQQGTMQRGYLEGYSSSGKLVAKVRLSALGAGLCE